MRQVTLDVPETNNSYTDSHATCSEGHRWVRLDLVNKELDEMEIKHNEMVANLSKDSSAWQIAFAGEELRANELQSRCDWLVEALKKHGCHGADCDYSYGHDCNCGLKQAITKAQEGGV